MFMGMPQSKLRRIAWLPAALAFTVGASATDTCTGPDATAAQKAVDRVVTWAQLQQSWRDWHRCDSGAVGEQFTDALLRLMVEWKNVPALATAMKEPAFHDFVFAHLKTEAAKPDLSSVYSRARSDCPPGHDAFCSEIAEATK